MGDKKKDKIDSLGLEEVADDIKSAAVSAGGSVIEAVGEAAKATAEKGKKAGAGIREKGDEFIDNVSKEIKKKNKD